MKIIAITSCPVGVAHTYMSAAALEKAAEKEGHQIKVETQGGLGFKNKLNKEDIKNTDVIIFATDITCLEKDRFKGVPALETTTKKCIKDAPAVINQALDLIR